MQVSKLTVLCFPKDNLLKNDNGDTDIYNTAIVNKKYNGWRIDKFLTASFPDISRSQIQRLLNEGNVSCNGAVIEDNSCKVRENETYQLIIPEPEGCGARAGRHSFGNCV